MFVCAIAFRASRPPCGGKPKTIPRKLVKNRPRDPLPSSHYYLRSLSWTSRIFYFLGSRDLLEVLIDFLGGERGEVPRGSSWTLGDPPYRVSLSAKEVLREPREGPDNLRRRRSWWAEVMSPSNNDYGYYDYYVPFSRISLLLERKYGNI